MKKCLFLFLWFAILCSISAENFVAVVPFGVDEALAADEEAIREILLVELDNAGLTIVTRDFAGILSEAGFQRSSGLVDETTIADIGYATGANYVVYGTFKHIWGSYNISCSIISVESGILYGSGTVGIEALDYETVVSSVKDLVAQMLNTGNNSAQIVDSSPSESITLDSPVYAPPAVENITIPESFVHVQGNDMDFWISKYEYPGEGLPMVSISWFEACALANQLSIEEGLEPAYYSDRNFQNVYEEGNRVFWKGNSFGYRLPTDSEWNFAARGGSLSRRFRYSGGNSLSDVAWWAGNSGREPHPVGQLEPNELGIYDMTGNVEEWTWNVSAMGWNYETREIERFDLSFRRPRDWMPSRNERSDQLGLRFVRSNP